MESIEIVYHEEIRLYSIAVNGEVMYEHLEADEVAAIIQEIMAVK